MEQNIPEPIQCNDVEEVLEAMRCGAIEIQVRDNLNPQAAGLIAESLKDNTTLARLILGASDTGGAIGAIGDEGVWAIAEALKVNRSLQRLTFVEQQIGTAGIRHLGEALKSNCQLRLLEVAGSSPIRIDGIQSLAEALESNTNLQQLYFVDTAIDDAGAQVLADVLKSNVSLRQLILVRAMGATGVQALAAALKSNCRLSELLFAGLIGTEGVEALGSALKSNTHLRALFLYDSQIGEAGAQELAEGLTHNKGLQRLNIMFDNVGDGGARALAEALKGNQRLLNLECDSLAADVAAEIQTYMERNRRRKMLLTMRFEGDRACCYAMSGEQVGPSLTVYQLDGVLVKDWCQMIADSVGQPLERLDFVGAPGLIIDIVPGLTVWEAISGSYAGIPST